METMVVAVKESAVVLAAVLAGVAGHILWLGFQKTIVEPFAAHQFRKGANRLLAAMPDVFRVIDVMMPAKMASSTGDELSAWIEGVMETATGEDWGDATEDERSEMLRIFFDLYDPRIGADRRHALRIQGMGMASAPPSVKPPTPSTTEEQG